MAGVKNEITIRREKHDAFVQKVASNVIAAMPLSVPTEALERARARFRVVFSADAAGKFYECTPESVGRAVVLSALSGLLPGGPNPDVWLIPRRNKHKGGALEINWQISHRGYVRLARRASWDMEPVLVFEGERFEMEEGIEPRIKHLPNLDGEQTWETLRGGYVRVFPAGNRTPPATKVAWLSKKRIAERRAKAQDDSVWKEWPLEQALKTLCNFAGQREMFPCDDPARYAMAEDLRGETGDTTIVSLPAGNGESATDRLAARLTGGEAPTIDASGTAIDGEPVETEVEPVAAEGRLEPGTVTRLRALAEKMKVGIGEVEELYGESLDTLPASKEAEVEAEIRQRGKR